MAEDSRQSSSVQSSGSGASTSGRTAMWFKMDDGRFISSTIPANWDSHLQKTYAEKGQTVRYFDTQDLERLEAMENEGSTGD
ncbi:hypothetical protein I203_107913 [Kwoniella mangroviensis CBS 8507]|uniref:hypothetical protein n=1 Tax=Kwoniella mangroviensis CBS 8507 TaxID=1296122 RepID=UPI00080D15CA|nr:uncharacterized protein I203_04807 [Kwoniella mangroviensis CBS 8507]OCF65789.1 hypothetical protein I203_04807 [Kwoniella mangroviensis CBS 8507]